MGSGLSMNRQTAFWALLAPPLLFVGIFFVVPLLNLFWVSLHGASSTELFGSNLSGENYYRILTDSFYHTIILRTLWAGMSIMLLCLVLGYATERLIMLLLLVAPLMVSNVIRAYGWIAILGRQGVVNSMLRSTGLIDGPLLLLNSFEAVAFGLMTILLPYMVVSIVNALNAIDRQYIEAAQSLKANPVRSFIYVVWPLSSPGVASGTLLVFLLTLSAYVTITLLGGPRMKLLVSLVFDSVSGFRWPLAAALSFALLTLALVVAGLILALLRPGRVQGRG